MPRLRNAARIFARPAVFHHKRNYRTLERIDRLYEKLSPFLAVALVPVVVGARPEAAALWSLPAAGYPFFYRVKWYPWARGLDRDAGYRRLTLVEFTEFYGLEPVPSGLEGP